MRSLCIFSFYDAAGVVDRYVLYLLNQLSRISKELIVVVNGQVNEAGERNLRAVADRVLFRVNKGFDAGAYKYALKVIGREYLRQFERLILCNDTFYGPLLSLEAIFKQMAPAKYDFWGLAGFDNKILRYLQSYFLVFHQAILEQDLPALFFRDYIDENEQNLSNVLVDYEIGLYDYLVKQNFRAGAFAGVPLCDIYKSGNFAIKKYRLPLLKKKCFAPEHYNRNNINDALQYIEEQTGYDPKLIWENADRIYGLSGTEADGQRKSATPLYEHLIPQVRGAGPAIESFAGQYQRIYIYGGGTYAKFIWQKYRNVFKDFKGFIISDDQLPADAGGSYKEQPIYRRSNIRLDHQTGVIVAMSKTHTDQLRAQLSEINNKLFLWD